MPTDLFGQGLEYPLQNDGAGRLVVSSGSDRLWATTDAILDCPQGCCPMDPGFGLSLSAYDHLRSAAVAGHQVANAIERSEPRAERIDIELTDVDAATGEIRMRVELTPSGTNVPTNRVLGLFGLTGT